MTRIIVAIVASSLFSGGQPLLYVTVIATAYNAEVAQTDDTPYITASNTYVREGIIAVSRDLEKDYGVKFGDKVYLKDIGMFEVQDRMNRRYKKRVDIFMWDRGKALRFGKRRVVMLLEMDDA